MSNKFDTMLDQLTSQSSSGWSKENELALLEPLTYISSNPGKEVRTMLIEAFNQWLHVPESKLKVINRVVSLLHNASLLVDDIEDDSQLRRGMPVAHRIYGIPQTINTANYVYFLAYQELACLRNSGPDVCRMSPVLSKRELEEKVMDTERLIPNKDLDIVVNAELLSLHRGQGLEMLWRDSLQCPTEEEYVEVVKNKTGGLFRIAIKLMMACATTSTTVDYIPLVNLIGIYFQIRDDYMNLQSDQYSTHKGFAEDLSEGKFSFPVIHGVRAKPENRQILNILQKRPKTPPLKVRAISYLKNESKSFEYTLSVCRTLEKQARDEIRRLGGNRVLEGILDSLTINTKDLLKRPRTPDDDDEEEEEDGRLNAPKRVKSVIVK